MEGGTPPWSTPVRLRSPLEIKVGRKERGGTADVLLVGPGLRPEAVNNVRESTARGAAGCCARWMPGLACALKAGEQELHPNTVYALLSLCSFLPNSPFLNRHISRVQRQQWGKIPQSAAVAGWISRLWRCGEGGYEWQSQGKWPPHLWKPKRFLWDGCAEVTYQTWLVVFCILYSLKFGYSCCLLLESVNNRLSWNVDQKPLKNNIVSRSWWNLMFFLANNHCYFLHFYFSLRLNCSGLKAVKRAKFVFLNNTSFPYVRIIKYRLCKGRKSRKNAKSK